MLKKLRPIFCQNLSSQECILASFIPTRKAGYKNAIKVYHVISFVLQSNMKHSVGIIFGALLLNLCYGLPTGICFLDNLKIFFILESNHEKQLHTLKSRNLLKVETKINLKNAYSAAHA